MHGGASGAQDYLEWPFDLRTLRKCIERLIAGGGRLAKQEQQRADNKALIDALSPRETAMLHPLVDGFANKEMAGLLGVSARTVEIHRGNMMRKLKRAEAFGRRQDGALCEFRRGRQIPSRIVARIFTACWG